MSGEDDRGAACLPQPFLAAAPTRSKSDLSAASLVCKRWRRVLFSEPALWRLFKISLSSMEEAERRTGLLRLLERVGGLLHHLKLDCGWFDGGLDAKQVAAVAACLPRLGQLGRISIYTSAHPVPPVLLEALPVATALTSVKLRCSQLPANAAGALARMTQLRSMTLRGSALQKVAAQALQRLPQLETLSLSFRAAEAGGTQALQAALSQMAALRSLSRDVPGITVAGIAASAVQLRQLTELQLTFEPPMPSLSLLPSHLRQLQRITESFTWGEEEHPPWPRPAAFPALQSFLYSSHRDQIELEQVRCAAA